MKLRYHHTAFTVLDLNESISWYKDKLGFTLVNKFKKGEMEFALINSGELQIELFCFGKNTKQLPDYRYSLMEDLHHLGTKHICMKVDDLDETITELKDKDVKTATEVDKAAFGGKYIFIKDINGILIELYSS